MSKTKPKLNPHPKSLKQAFKNGIRYALTDLKPSWEEIEKEIFQDLYLCIDWHGETEIKMVDGAGSDRITVPLSKLMDEEITVWGKDPDFIDEFEGIAEEFERYAKRLRALVKKTTADYEKFQQNLYPSLNADEATIEAWKNSE